MQAVHGPRGVATGAPVWRQLREDPHALYRALRPEGPVHWLPDVEAWLVIGHAEVKQCLQDSRLSSDRGQMIQRLLREAEPREFAPLLGFFQGWMLMNDPPRHTRMRRAFRDALDGELLRRVAARLPAHVDALLDRARARPEPDWVRDVAVPLPCLVVADLLDHPELDLEAAHVYAERLYDFFDATRDRLAAARALQDSVLWLDREVHRLLRARRGSDDLPSRLLRGGDQPAIDRRELVATCGMLLFGANALPRYFIAGALHALLAHPEQRAAWPLSAGGAADPTRLSHASTTALNELLRHAGPTHLLTRVVSAPFELAGRTLRAGDAVWLSVLAAHRDPQCFSDPDTLDLQRAGVAPLSFGSGPHRCLGATLGMLECEAALSGLFRASPGVTLGRGAPSYRPSLEVRGLRRLQIAWTNV